MPTRCRQSGSAIYTDEFACSMGGVSCYLSEESPMSTGTIHAANAERSVSSGGSGCAVAAESGAPRLLWETERRHRGICTEPCKTLTPEAIGSAGILSLTRSCRLPAIPVEQAACLVGTDPTCQAVQHLLKHWRATEALYIELQVYTAMLAGSRCFVWIVVPNLWRCHIVLPISLGSILAARAFLTACSHSGSCLCCWTFEHACDAGARIYTALW